MKKRKLRKMLAEAQASVSAPAGMRLRKWAKSYWGLLEQRSYCAQTLRNHKATLAHIVSVWGDQRLGEIKPHHVSTGLTALAKQSTHLAVRAHGDLKDLFTEAIANGKAEVNPVLAVRPPRHQTGRGRLSLDVWQRMLERSKTHRQRWIRAMLLLALLTGQRRADLAKMRFDDVVDGHLRVEQQKKARKPRGARIALPLTLRLECVGMSLADVIELCKTIGKPGDTLLRKANGSPIEMSSLSSRFHDLIVAELGQGAYELRKWPSLHEVRSLSARTYKAEGLADRQGLLGHANAAMTTTYEDARDLADDSTWRVVRT